MAAEGEGVGWIEVRGEGGKEIAVAEGGTEAAVEEEEGGFGRVGGRREGGEEF